FSAFLTLRDPEDPAARVIETALLREEAQTLRVNGETVDAVHSTRSGDVIVISRPPYQFDAAPRGQAIGDAPFFGQHGFLPGLVDLRRNINMRVPLLAAGPGIPVGRVVRGVRMIDLAPTIAHALGIPAPARAQGRVLVELFGATR
ncbi:MAG: hypothetical protein HY660_13795, partial [Armatimonadetes bacterium]|nr:hypothetical protein [Armatimonadota bacterium]